MENTFEVTFRFTAPLDMAKCEEFAERLMDQFPDNVAVSVHQVPNEEPKPSAPDVATPPDQHLVLEHGLMDNYVNLLTPESMEAEHLHQHKRDNAQGIKATHTHEGMTL